MVAGPVCYEDTEEMPVVVKESGSSFFQKIDFDFEHFYLKHTSGKFLAPLSGLANPDNNEPLVLNSERDDCGLFKNSENGVAHVSEKCL